MIFSIFLFSCEPTFIQHIKDICKEREYTVEQTEDIIHQVLVKDIMIEAEDGSRKINYDYLSVADALKKVIELRNSIKQILESDSMGIQMIRRDFKSFDDNLKTNQKILTYIEKVLKEASLQARFQAMIASSTYREEETKFNLESIYPYTPVILEAKYVEAARKNNTLEPVEVFNLDTSFKREVPDSLNPKETKVVWKVATIKVIVYDTKQDGIGNYVEIFKDDIEKPVVRLFTSLYGSTPDIAIIELEDSGESVIKTIYGLSGYRMADKVYKTMDLVETLYKESTILDIKFIEEKNHAFIVETDPQAELEEYETSETGWTIPFAFKNTKEDNFSIDLVVEEGIVKYISVTWKGTGDVAEFFAMKSPDFSSYPIEYFDLDKYKNVISVLPDEGIEIKAKFTHFCKDQPYMIDYTLGKNRYRIVDLDGDGVFESRKKIAK